MVSSSSGREGGHDDAALDEIELAGELMIAATASTGERLPTERIDEVLLERPGQAAAGPADPSRPAQPVEPVRPQQPGRPPAG
ncbi:hypothetical protein [Kitasatospora sp. NPDC050543]|uniref:hypothetical protein n=1 Tax=Kitasatospora sp. NPDC050543 TaxID=3364054 RepID=UPI0037A5F950